MLDIEHELKYPLYDEGWLKKIFIGGILNILPVICFIPVGYAYRVFARTFRGEEVIPLPSWDKWQNDFFKGFIIFSIIICWMIIPFIILLVNTFLGLLAITAVAFLLPMAVSFYTIQERFSEAFCFKKIWERIFESRTRYVGAWLSCFVLFVIGFFIWRLPIVGYPLSAFLFFYIFLVYARLLGLACNQEAPLSSAAESVADN